MSIALLYSFNEVKFPCRGHQGDYRAALAVLGNYLEAEAARDRIPIDRLESAILAKAFRGELVPPLLPRN